jgi:ABC-type cobalt transport system substrate-binding protein
MIAGVIVGVLVVIAVVIAIVIIMMRKKEEEGVYAGMEDGDAEGYGAEEGGGEAAEAEGFESD